MKKLLLAIFSLLALSTFAQKDIEVSIVLPQEGEIIRKGQNFNLAGIIKNTGMETIYPTDTILVIFSINGNPLTINGGNIFIAPNADSLERDSVTGIIFPNLSLNVTQEDTDAQFCVTAVIRNGTIVAESNTANNDSCHKVQLLFPTAVNEIELAASSVKVFPNPVSDVLNITIDYNKASTVNVLDITGRLIETVAIENGAAKVQVGGLGHGIYMYQIMSKEGKNIKSGKFTVNN